MAIPLPGSVTSAVSGAKASLTGQLGSWLPHLPHLDWQSAFQQQQRLLRIDFPTPTDFIVDRFEGEESLTDGFIWTIDLLSPDTHRELKSLIGQPVTLWLKQSDGSERPFSGRVFTVSQLGSDGGLVQFRMTVEPTLHLLRFARTPRVYQQRTAQGMIDDLLRRHQQKLPDLQWQWQLSKPLPAREYRLQVEESDLDFVRRVLHESGLFCVVQHAGSPVGSHTLVFCDDSFQLAALPERSLRYHRAASSEDGDTLTHWEGTRQLHPGQVGHRRYDEHPAGSEDHVVNTRLDHGPAGSPLAAALTWHSARPHRDGEDNAHFGQQAERELQAHESAARTFATQGNVRALQAGGWFELGGHPQHDAEPADARQFLALSVRHRARNPLGNGPAAGEAGANTSNTANTSSSNLSSSLSGGLSGAFTGGLASLTGGQSSPGAEAPASDNSPLYQNHAVLIRRNQPFTPPVPPRPRASGPMTAVVVGPAGEVIHTDAMGRIKVQFHWQRPDEHGSQGAVDTGGKADHDETSSCWIRVASRLAGNGFGDLYLPRIGQEVLVEFLDGDLDRPIVTGTLFHGRHAPPTFDDRGSLPNNRALSGIKTQALDGSGYNQLLFDDTPQQHHTTLTSSQHDSRLQLGTLTHPRSDGKAEHRGDGFELGTQGWGSVRADKGLLLSTHPDHGDHLNSQSLARQLQQRLEQATSLSEQAGQHRAETLATLKPLQDTLQSLQQTAPRGEQHTAAYRDPELALSTPANLLLGADHNATLATGENLTSLQGGHFNQATGKTHASSIKELWSVLVSGVAEGGKAVQDAIRLIAGKGKVTLAAHAGPMDLLADQDIQVSSVNGKITITAPQEILINAGGAAVHIKGGNIDLIAPGKISIKASQKVMEGPGNVPASVPQLPTSTCKECMFTALKSGSPFSQSFKA